MSTTPADSPDFFEILYRSYRLIKSHRRHFSALSALFLLPLSLSLILCSRLQASLSNSTFNHNHPRILLAVLLYVFVFFVYLSAVGTISYSAIHALHATPPQIGSSLKSLLNSFLRLLSTSILSHVIMFMVCLCAAIFKKLICGGFEILEIDYNDFKLYIIRICDGAAVVLLAWLQLKWGLALVVVVAEKESKWGYGPLRRSAYLIKGMKSVAFSVLNMDWVVICLIIQWSYLITVGRSGGVWWWWMVPVLVFSLVAGLMLTLVSNAVLYMHGKALHGDCVEEFPGQYVSLPKMR